MNNRIWFNRLWGKPEIEGFPFYLHFKDEESVQEFVQEHPQFTDSYARMWGGGPYPYVGDGGWEDWTPKHRSDFISYDAECPDIIRQSFLPYIDELQNERRRVEEELWNLKDEHDLWDHGEDEDNDDGLEFFGGVADLEQGPPPEPMNE